MKNLRLIIILVVVVSCGQSIGKKIEKKETDGGDKVYSFAQDDEEMNAAVLEAIKTYPEFERIFLARDTSLSQFSVKMFFVHEDGKEHMWVNDLHLKDEKLYGILDSDPMYIYHLKIGDTLLVNRDSISDWLYVKNGKMVGGYTLKVTYNNLNEEEKKELKAVLPFEIE